MKRYTAHRIAPFLTTLSDDQGHSPIAGLFNYDFSCNHAAADKISTDLSRRAVPLRQLRFSPVASWRIGNSMKERQKDSNHDGDGISVTISDSSMLHWGDRHSLSFINSQYENVHLVPCLTVQSYSLMATRHSGSRQYKQHIAPTLTCELGKPLLT